MWERISTDLRAMPRFSSLLRKHGLLNCYLLSYWHVAPSRWLILDGDSPAAADVHVQEPGSDGSGWGLDGLWPSTWRVPSGLVTIKPGGFARTAGPQVNSGASSFSSVYGTTTATARRPEALSYLDH